MKGPERHSLGEAASLLGKPAVQLTGHARAVGVGEEAEAFNPVALEALSHLLGIGGMSKPPSPLGEPPMDRGEEPRRVEVGVEVEDGRVDDQVPLTVARARLAWFR
jgi:hypothetical protein